MSTYSNVDVHQKLVQDPWFEKGYQKVFKKVTWFFLSNPIPFNGKDYEKQKGPGTRGQ